MAVRTILPKDLSEAPAELQHFLVCLNDSQASSTKQLDSLRSDLSDLFAQQRIRDETVIKNLQDEVRMLRSELSKTLQELSSIRGQLGSHGDQLAQLPSLQEELVASQRDIRQIGRRIDAQNAEAAQMNAAIGELVTPKDLQKVQRDISALRVSTDKFRHAIVNTISDVDTRVGSLESSRKTAGEDTEKLRRSLGVLTGQISNIGKQMDSSTPRQNTEALLNETRITHTEIEKRWQKDFKALGAKVRTLESTNLTKVKEVEEALSILTTHVEKLVADQRAFQKQGDQLYHNSLNTFAQIDGVLNQMNTASVEAKGKIGGLEQQVERLGVLLEELQGQPEQQAHLELTAKQMEARLEARLDTVTFQMAELNQLREKLDEEAGERGILRMEFTEQLEALASRLQSMRIPIDKRDDFDPSSLGDSQRKPSPDRTSEIVRPESARIVEPQNVIRSGSLATLEPPAINVRVPAAPTYMTPIVRSRDASSMVVNQYGTPAQSPPTQTRPHPSPRTLMQLTAAPRQPPRSNSVRLGM